MKRPIIGITQGDFNGIGPEIILKALKEFDLQQSRPLLIGNASVFKYYNSIFETGLQFEVISDLPSPSVSGENILLLETEAENSEIFTPDPGKLTVESGKAAMQAVDKAIELCMDGKIGAMVTAPISKEAVNLAGYHIPGHTEYLAEKTGAKSVLMILVTENLRVALTTVHIPVADIAKSITKELILDRLKVLDTSLKEDFGIKEPAIAVLGLNPHAGDGGVLGTEELEIINPALQLARNNLLSVAGPHSADGFFGQKNYQNYDAVLAMYHDQGLVPFKTLSFGAGVNFTAGLPIIRTSPDHGTAFNIAGKGIANPSSLEEAYHLAVKLVNERG